MNPEDIYDKQIVNTLVLGTYAHLGIAAGNCGKFRIHEGFSIAENGASGSTVMPDSFVSTPSRYLTEMLAVAESHLAASRHVLIFNPRFRLTNFIVQASLAHLSKYEGSAAILSAARDMPIAYFLNADSARSRRLLLLLSCSSTSIDVEYLEAAFLNPVDRLESGIPLFDGMADGFLPGNYRRPMEWCAVHATRLLKSRCGDSSVPLKTRLAVRDALPIKAFSTHHAGDVLFMSIAAQDAASPYYDEILVHEDYLPITRRIGGRIPFSPLRCEIPFRGDYRKEDSEHFLDVAPKLPEDAFYVYCRTTRNYNYTNFHCINHFCFCLGLPWRQKPRHSEGSARSEISAAAVPKRILLHFDAGWPLKIYPITYQQQLVEKLLAIGYIVSTLDAKTAIPGAESVRFSTLDAFDDLLAGIDVLVGMDSFPAHYAAITGKSHTIHLFASTHPVHSECDSGPSHISLQRGEICCPCFGWDKCFRYGGGECHNFSAPDAVISALQQLLSGALPSIDQVLPPMPSRKRPRRFGSTLNPDIARKFQPLSLPAAHILTVLHWALVPPRVALILGREFFITVRRDGLRKALYLTFSFLRRNLMEPRRTTVNAK